MSALILGRTHYYYNIYSREEITQLKFKSLTKAAVKCIINSILLGK